MFLTRRMPFQPMTTAVSDDFDRVFESLLGEHRRNGSERPAGIAPLDIWSDETAYHVEIEVPGFRIEDLDLSIDDGELVIRGERREMKTTPASAPETAAAAAADATASGDSAEPGRSTEDGETSEITEPVTRASTSGRVLHRRERRVASFRRVVRLPENIDGERIEASLDHGVLSITLPKAEAAQPRRIEVKAGGSDA